MLRTLSIQSEFQFKYQQGFTAIRSPLQELEVGPQRRVYPLEHIYSLTHFAMPGQVVLWPHLDGEVH